MRIGAEGNVIGALAALDVESVPRDGSQVLLVHSFFFAIELATLVQEFSADEALHTERQHHADGRSAIFGRELFAFRDFRRIEIGRNVVICYFAVSHDDDKRAIWNEYGKVYVYVVCVIRVGTGEV